MLKCFMTFYPDDMSVGTCWYAGSVSTLSTMSFLMTGKKLLPLAESHGFATRAPASGLHYVSLHLFLARSAMQQLWIKAPRCLLPSDFDAQHAATALAPAAMNPQTPAAGSALPLSNMYTYRVTLRSRWPRNVKQFCDVLWGSRFGRRHPSQNLFINACIQRFQRKNPPKQLDNLWLNPQVAAYAKSHQQKPITAMYS